MNFFKQQITDSPQALLSAVLLQGEADCALRNSCCGRRSMGVIGDSPLKRLDSPVQAMLAKLKKILYLQFFRELNRSRPLKSLLKPALRFVFQLTLCLETAEMISFGQVHMLDLGEIENRLLRDRWWPKWVTAKLVGDAPDEMNA